MEDIILRYIVWIGIIIAIGIIVLLSSNEIDIKIAVWFRLIMSLFILVLGNILLYKYYHSIGSLVVLKIISMILIVYACLDIPAKIAGVYYKRKLAIDDFSINSFDEQLNKLGYKPLVVSFVIVIGQFIGCSKINDYYNNQLDSEGILQIIVIKDKQYERIRNNVYDSIVYFDFQFKKQYFEGSVRCRGFNIGDSATIKFDPSNMGNCKLINKYRSTSHATVRFD